MIHSTYLTIDHPPSLPPPAAASMTTPQETPRDFRSPALRPSPRPLIDSFASSTAQEDGASHNVRQEGGSGGRGGTHRIGTGTRMTSSIERLTPTGAEDSNSLSSSAFLPQGDSEARIKSMLGRPSESIESAYKEGELSRLKKVVGLQGEEIELLYRELETKDATIRQMRAQHDGLLQANEVARAQLWRCEEERCKLEGLLHASKAELTSAHERVLASERECEDIKTAVGERLDREGRRMKAEEERVAEMKRSWEREVQEGREQCEAMRAKVVKAEQEVGRLHEEVEAERRERGRAQDDAKEAAKEREELRRKLVEAEGRSREGEEELKELRRALDRAEKDASRARIENEGLKARVELLTERLTQAEDRAERRRAQAAGACTVSTQTAAAPRAVDGARREDREGHGHGRPPEAKAPGQGEEGGSQEVRRQLQGMQERVERAEEEVRRWKKRAEGRSRRSSRERRDEREKEGKGWAGEGRGWGKTGEGNRGQVEEERGMPPFATSGGAFSRPLSFVSSASADRDPLSASVSKGAFSGSLGRGTSRSGSWVPLDEKEAMRRVLERSFGQGEDQGAMWEDERVIRLARSAAEEVEARERFWSSALEEERKRVDETRALAESLRFEHSGMKVENADLREEIERLCRDLEEMKRRREEEVKAMDEAERRCRAATATQTEHAPAHQTSVGSVLGGPEDSDSDLKEARASQEAEAQRKETRETEARSQSLERKVKRLKAQVEAMTQRLKLGEEAVKEAEEKERMARREAARLQEEVKALRAKTKEYGEVTGQMLEELKRFKQLEEEVKRVRGAEKEGRREVERLKGEAGSLGAEAEALRRQLREATDRCEALSRQRDEALAHLRDERERCNQLSSAMKRTRSRLEEYERQVADVKVETKHTAGQVQVLRRMLGASVNHTGAVAQVLMRTTASLQKAVHVGVGGHGDTVDPTINETGSAMREGKARRAERDRSDRGSRVEEVTDRPPSPHPRPRAPSDLYDGEQGRPRKATEGREEPRRRRLSSSGGEKEARGGSAWNATEMHDRSPSRRRESSDTTTRRPARSASPSSYIADKDRRADKDQRPRSTATPSADPSSRPPPRVERRERDESFSSAAKGEAGYRPWEEKMAERRVSSRADDSFELRASRDSAAEKERFSKEAANSRGSVGENQASPTRQHLSGLLERCQLLKRELQRAVVSHEDEG